MARIEIPRPIRGTQSMIGEEADRFHHVVQTFDRVRRLYGFGRVELPVFEATAVFARSLGETTDVVSKEMYSFEDRGGDSLTLRPEFTAGIARAYLTEGWQQYAPLKVATHGPVFRYERPQKGRFRQFHQLDAEVIGAPEPAADVELLCFADQLLRELKIEGVTLKLNTLGDAASRDAWRASLVAHFEAHRGDLSDDSLARLERNPMRILDSKDPRDRPAADSAPAMVLSSEAADFFARVLEGLGAADVVYDLAPSLVRGLDYYRHTAFEFVTDRLGAQGTVIGGGRYDGLIEALGGPYTPAVGWAAGIERLGMMIDCPRPDRVAFAIIPVGTSAENIASELANKFRRWGSSVQLEYKGSLKRRLSKANTSGAAWAIIIGDSEISRGVAIIKYLLDDVRQNEVKLDDLRNEAEYLHGIGFVVRDDPNDSTGWAILAEEPSLG